MKMIIKFRIKLGFFMLYFGVDSKIYCDLRVILFRIFFKNNGYFCYVDIFYYFLKFFYYCLINFLIYFVFMLKVYMVGFFYFINIYIIV